jgi:hypothetical protein
MAIYGFNFRATSGYVSDSNPDTYCIRASNGETGDAYPTTRGTPTRDFGTTNHAFSNFQGRDRDSGVNAKLAGIVFAVSSSPVDIRVDISGSLKIRLALGDASFSQTVQCEIRDSAGVKATVPASPTATTGAAYFYDATGVERTSVADWLSNNAQAGPYTFADYVLIRLTGDVYPIAHLEIEEVAGAAARSPFSLFTHTPFCNLGPLRSY